MDVDIVSDAYVRVALSKFRSMVRSELDLKKAHLVIAQSEKKDGHPKA